jgi:arylsulfatase A-like enzyme
MDVHDPYLPPHPYRTSFSQLENPGGLLNWRVGRSNPVLTAEQIQNEIDAYDGAIRYVDEQINHLLSELQRRHLSDNTIVILTSDHGEMFGEQGLFLHGNSLYLPSGVRIKRDVANTSLAPTVMDLLGERDRSGFVGPSLASFWQSPALEIPYPEPSSFVAKQPWVEATLPVSQGSIKSIVSEKWHYIENESLGEELYNLEEDAKEAHNLADKPEVQSIREQLRFKLQEIMAGSRTRSELVRLSK